MTVLAAVQQDDAQARPAQTPTAAEGTPEQAGRWPRMSVDLPPDVHEALTRFAFEHRRLKVMHIGQALVEIMLEDEELQQRVIAHLPTMRRKAPQGRVGE